MKHSLWIVSLMCLLLSGTEASAQEPRHRGLQVDVAVSQSAFTAAVRKVRRLEFVSYRVGWTLEAGEFHTLSEECLRYGSLEDLKALLGEESPILRVLGLICLAKSVGPEEFLAIAKPLYVDRAQVRITNGCVLNQSATVGAIAEQLAGDRFFLAAEEKGLTR
jgi:hypothetical protein